MRKLIVAIAIVSLSFVEHTPTLNSHAAEKSHFNQNTTLADLQFLTGKWKVENKNNYETWKRNADNTLSGSSFETKNGKEIISEYLSIALKGNNIVYSAKVLNQNNGKPVEFVLNKAVSNKLSFENLKHDFPKKIQYTKLNDKTLFVEVLGEGDKGFSYKMMKQ